MAKFAPLMFAPPVIFAALAGVLYVGLQREDPDGLPSAFAGKPAPEVSVAPLGTMTGFTSEDLKTGDIKLVNFWASWCAPCRAEHPNLEKLAQDGMTIYGVNYKDDPQKALGFLAELGNPYTAGGADAAGKMALNWGLYGVPETYVIDKDGTILLRFAGPVTERALKSTILPVINAAR